MAGLEDYERVFFARLDYPRSNPMEVEAVTPIAKYFQLEHELDLGRADVVMRISEVEDDLLRRLLYLQWAVEHNLSRTAFSDEAGYLSSLDKRHLYFLELARLFVGIASDNCPLEPEKDFKSELRFLFCEGRFPRLFVERIKRLQQTRTFLVAHSKMLDFLYLIQMLSELQRGIVVECKHGKLLISDRCLFADRKSLERMVEDAVFGEGFEMRFSVVKSGELSEPGERIEMGELLDMLTKMEEDKRHDA